MKFAALFSTLLALAHSAHGAVNMADFINSGALSDLGETFPFGVNFYPTDKISKLFDLFILPTIPFFVAQLTHLQSINARLW